eukprot:8554683-Lingulodinium_polyedra.AAC.1
MEFMIKVLNMRFRRRRPTAAEFFSAAVYRCGGRRSTELYCCGGGRSCGPQRFTSVRSGARAA